MTDGTYAAPVPVEDPEALAATERVQADLAGSVRGLIDACVRTRVAEADMTAVAAEARALTERLLSQAQDGPLGLEAASDGRLHDHGNPMVGRRNPIAPPLVVTGDDEGNTQAPLLLGAAYEGPPGCVHGGILAAVADQVVGSVPAMVGLPGMTAYLTTTYRRPTLLGVEHSCRGWVDRVEGWKVFARGDIRDPEGRTTVEIEGLFVVPRWAREHLSAPTGDAGDFGAPGDDAPTGTDT